jgi:hypothetical protein
VRGLRALADDDDSTELVAIESDDESLRIWVDGRAEAR